MNHPSAKTRKRVPAAAGWSSFVMVLIAACGGSSAPPAATPVSAKCPDVANGDELGAFEFAKEFGLAHDAADKLKAAALAASEIDALAERLDADLGIACTQIAQELGAKGDWRSGDEACSATVKSVQDTRSKFGPKAQAKLVMKQPLCLVDASLLTKCASICDSSVPAGRAKTTCAVEAGHCDGNCTGACDREGKSPAKCEGACSGTCEGMIKGTCGGRCTGTCDGKAVRGAPCLGVCAGSCEKGVVVGECKGLCTGSCTREAAVICDGICAGSCSVSLDEARCSVAPKSPEISAACRTRCDLIVLNRSECTPPQVGLLVSGPRDRVAGDTLMAAVNHGFPALMKVLAEVGEDGSNRIAAAKALLDGTRSDFNALAKSPSAASALAKCFDEPFKKASAKAAAAKASIDLALSVRDEATKADAPKP